MGERGRCEFMGNQLYNVCEESNMSNEQEGKVEVTQDAAAAAPPAEEKKKKKPTSIKALGVSCDRNARHRRTMEDAHVYIDGFGDVEHQGYFAIYDGHGGKAAVELVAKRLHEVFLEELNNVENSESEEVKDAGISGAYERAYLRTDEEIQTAEILYSGTTTVSAFLRREGDVRKLYISNCGDARAVLSRGGTAQRLTKDHKATDDEEVKRIEAVGGFVAGGRVNGILAVARSLGDRAMKQYVSGEPYTADYVLNDDDTHLILACDGVWDVIQDQEAVDLIKEYNTCEEASKALLIAALNKGSTDNISVMVIAL